MKIWTWTWIHIHIHTHMQFFCIWVWIWIWIHVHVHFYSNIHNAAITNTHSVRIQHPHSTIHTTHHTTHYTPHHTPHTTHHTTYYNTTNDCIGRSVCRGKIVEDISGKDDDLQRKDCRTYHQWRWMIDSLIIRMPMFQCKITRRNWIHRLLLPTDFSLAVYFGWQVLLWQQIFGKVEEANNSSMLTP